MIKRFLPLAGVCAAMTILMGGAASAAGGDSGGSPYAPGTYHIDSSRALASFFPPQGGGVDVMVGQGTFVLSPRGGSQVTLVTGTVLTLDLMGPSGDWSYGCFMIPSRDFILDPSLHSAHLTTALPETSNCGEGTLMTIDHRVLHRPGDPSRGGATIDVMWTWQGVVSTNQQTSQSRCGTYHNDTRDTDTLALTTATASISGVGDGLVAEPYSSLFSQSEDVTVTGTWGDLCAY